MKKMNSQMVMAEKEYRRLMDPDEHHSSEEDEEEHAHCVQNKKL